jgi:hypothetical protein
MSLFELPGVIWWFVLTPLVLLTTFQQPAMAVLLCRFFHLIALRLIGSRPAIT